MSAIIALLTSEKDRFPDSVADRMLSSMKHRGDDGVNKWSDGRVMLGHRMRFTTKESLSETLPNRSGRSGCVITGDARIDNRNELISEFGLGLGEVVTDSELILLAYEKWGDSCLNKLEGDFVFAIWDPRREELLCARDQLGVKHFYYYHEPGKLFAMASEVKALLTVPGIPRELNEQAVGDYLVFNVQDKESTFFKGIFRLPATHAMSVSLKRSDLKTRCYWSPEGIRELKLGSHAEYHEAFREKFIEAVNARLRSSFPVGGMLSGGLDSSSIVCAASDELRSRGSEPIHSYSAHYSETSKQHSELDEMQFMQSVIERSGCQAHFVDCDAHDPLRDMDHVMRHADHPVGMANLHVHLECFKEAAANGVRIMIDGTDGDSTVSHGYEAFGGLAKKGQFWGLFKTAGLLKANMPQKAHSLENLVFRNGIDQIIPDGFQKVWHSLTLRRHTYSGRVYSEFDKLQWRVIDKDFKREQDLEDKFRQMAAENSSTGKSPILSHWRNLTSGHYARVLEFAELASQSHGIEMRFPFFDRRLIEFCISVPPPERVYRGWTRSVFRHAMEGIVPKDVQWRTTKADLGPGLKLNLLKYRIAEIGDVIYSPSPALEPYLDMELLRRIYERFVVNPFKFDADCLILISVFHLDLWLEENLTKFQRKKVD